ncbi:hypothetical protein SAMN05216345_101891 [Cupriavidus sp. YR651]|nr:hypothetical protein SAMN05216345_101891 [Cupriavidus sp. YR651]
MGAGIKIARLRRGESIGFARQRAGVTRNTWTKLEEDGPGVAIGLPVEVLLPYGFDRQVFELASPEADGMGKRPDLKRLPKRGNSRAKV